MMKIQNIYHALNSGVTSEHVRTEKENQQL